MGEKVLMKGNEAIAEAAIRAGCMHYFGYPITPQTEIAAYMAKRMPKVGGGQEQNVHSGTEATPAIFSFGAAANAAGDVAANSAYVAELKKQLLQGIENISCVTINSPEDAIPYILNISILGLPSQPIVNFMSDKGIYISAGSACKMGHRSPVLTAMGLSPEVTDSAVRISLSRYNTPEEIDYLISAITEAAQKYGKKQR